MLVSIKPGQSHLTGRVLGITRTDTLPIPWTDSLVFAFDTATRSYDASGNMTESRQSIKEGDNIHDTVVRNYYSSDERLYATQKVDNALAGTNGVWEEYRYDPLGRRILVRAVREGLCAGMSLENGRKLCQSTLTRYVWSGDQILWEMRVPGADGEDLEKTAWSSGAANPTRFGRVSYLHAGGIDRPLAITKDGVGTIVPHQNWRGMFAWGTWATGANKGLLSDCTTGNQTGCMSLAWPGWQTSAWHEDGNPGEHEYWMGSLVDGMRDASGQIYMRNRYYDPATGQFTQTDPIGLAGGLNAYGFAAGDPVSYADPYGLSADSVWVGIRPLAWAGLGLVFSHSSVRVDNDMYELQNNKGTSVVLHTTVEGNSALDGYVWFPVATPAGQTDTEFSETVRQNALRLGGEINATRPDYEALGANCHAYTNSVITSSGGLIPGNAEIHGDRSSPGLCPGGRGCTPATRRPMFDYGAPPPLTP